MRQLQTLPNHRSIFGKIGALNTTGIRLVVLKIQGNFDGGFQIGLEIGPEQQRPTVRLQGQLPPLPEMPLYYSRWRDRYWALGDVRRLSAPRTQLKNVSMTELRQDCISTASMLRSRFQAWLQSPEFRPIQDKCLEVLSPDEALRLVVQTDNPDLQKLPWHCWDLLERYPQAEVAITPLKAEQPPARSPHGSVRVLAILGHSEGIDVEADRALLQALPNAKVTFLVEPQRQELSDRLWQQPWDIIFFAGHSLTETTQGRIFLNPKDSFAIEELKYALRHAARQGLQLAIFNSCDGWGIARDLAELTIPQTIVMREPVADQVAQTFLRYFLPAFSQGMPLYAAVRQAREQLQGLEDQFPCASWLPLIMQNLEAVPPTWWELTQKSGTGRLARSLAWSLSVAALVLGARHHGLLQPLELMAYDQLLQVRSAVYKEPEDSRIVVVTLRNADKTYLKEGFVKQPALRDGHKQKPDASKLKDKSILDQTALRDWQKQEPDAFKLKDKSISDAGLVQLLKILETAKPLAVGLDLGRDTRRENVSPKLVQQFQRSSTLVVVCEKKVKEPFPPGANQAGFADVLPDGEGGIVRRHLYLWNEGAPRLPGATPTCDSVQNSLSLQLAVQAVQHYVGGDQIRAIPPKQIQLGKVVLNPLEGASGGYIGNITDGYQILLNYRDRRFRTISLTDVLQQEGLEQLRGKIVLVGTDQPEIDQFNLPVGGRQSGVFLHAQMTSQLVSAALGERPLLGTWARPQEFLWIGGWAVVAGVLVWRVRSSLGVGVGTVLLLVSLTGLCTVSLIRFQVWVPWVPPMLVVVGVGAGAMVMHNFRPAARFRNSPLTR
jgi:CHASE2 domain-containing sensor protein